MSAPAIIVRLAIEEPVSVVFDALNDSEAIRVLDWIRAHPELEAIVSAALDILEAERGGVTLLLEEFGADRRIVVRPHVRHASAVAMLVDLDDVADGREVPVVAFVLAGARGLSVWLDELHVEGLHDGKHMKGAA